MDFDSVLSLNSTFAAGSCLTYGSSSTGGPYWGTVTTPCFPDDLVLRYPDPMPSFIGYNVTLPPENMKQSETSTAFIFQYALPGVELSDITSYIRSKTLYVDLNKDKEYLFPALTKNISLDVDDEDYDLNLIDLSLKDGILTISIQKNTPDKVLTVK